MKYTESQLKKGTAYKITQSLSPECDAEVVWVLTEMPAWRPATKDGVQVNVNYILPITFN